MVGNLLGAGAAAGVKDVPVGQLFTRVCEVGVDDTQVFVGEVAQAPGGMRVTRVAEAVEELRQGAEGCLEPGEDAVVRRGEFGEDVGCLRGVGGLAEAVGEVRDRVPERGITGGAGFAVEGLVAVDVVPGRPQPRYGVGRETGFVGLGEPGGSAVVTLVEADDSDESRPLKNAVCRGVAAAGEEFVRVRVTANVQEAVGGARQGDVSLTEIGEG